jgi:feruloyl esterase
VPILVIAVALLGAATAVTAAGAAAPASAPSTPVSRPSTDAIGAVAAHQRTGQRDAAELCRAMPAGEYHVPGDPSVQLTASRLVAAESATPAHCLLQGYVEPNTGLELRLPLAGWNGKFFHAGCTGSCGFGFDSAWGRECDYPLARGYACLVTDLGHRSGSSDGLWAWRNLETRVDFGFRATHRTTVAGKALVAGFYGNAPARSYFMGCSTGGRQGLVAAQRFPTDFDGIIAGAPVVSEAGTSMHFLWNLAALADERRRPLLGDAELRLLHEAVLAASDLDDGVRDGVIGDPRRSRFEPGSLQCRDGQSGGCLSAAQVDAVRKVYSGPVDSRGRPTTRGGGAQRGSEAGWTIFLPGADGHAPSERSGVDTTRYIMSDWGPGWSYRDFDFDRDPARLGELEVLYSAAQPDLRAFQAAGGKLMIYHGWADPIVAPLGTVDYYETVERTMGGRAPTQAFARLYMVPGMKHCFGGDGAFAIDYLDAMEGWVERGQPPEALRAAKLDGNHDSPSMIRPFPRAAREEVFTRPIYPYPIEYRYSGRGAPEQAGSFGPWRGTTTSGRRP